jgi:hypothetical protein
MTKVLPFCPYSSTLNVLQEWDSKLQTYDTPTNDQENPCLESKLWHCGIFQVPLSDPEYVDQMSRIHCNDNQPKDLSTDELEQKLWLALNQYWITTQKPISLILLSLLPLQPNIVWPEAFVLHKVVETLLEHRNIATANASVCITDIHSSLRLGYIQDFNPLDPSYPAHRRQRRLSFSAAYLLESGDEPEKSQRLRALLLSIPSTHQRLKVVLERFLQWQTEQNDKVGAFE